MSHTHKKLKTVAATAFGLLISTSTYGFEGVTLKYMPPQEIIEAPHTRQVILDVRPLKEIQGLCNELLDITPLTRVILESMGTNFYGCADLSEKGICIAYLPSIESTSKAFYDIVYIHEVEGHCKGWTHAGIRFKFK